MDLEEKLRLLPDRSGVYIFRDAGGGVLYVGKAKRLRLRVRSYFRRRGDDDSRLAHLVARIADLETIVTANENEALILEANLIKSHRPPFNIELKDDKRYPFLRVTMRHPFPGLFVTRRIVHDGSRYFGPYTHVKDLRQTLKTLRKIFPLRNCTDRRLERSGRECLEFFIERCPAPCTRRVAQEEYGTIVNRLVRFLEGDVASVVAELAERMREEADRHRYEEAARLRDAIATLERLVQQQRMTPALAADTDVAAVVGRGDRACGVILHVRDGRVLGQESRILLRAAGAAPGEILRAFLTHHYLETAAIPPVVAAAIVPREAATLERWLAETAGRPVRLRLARGTQLAPLAQAARENAHLRLEEEELRERRRRARIDAGVYDLQERLDLPRTPYRIEGFDISNLQATDAVASMVCFQDGAPQKGSYRRFRIRDVEGPDDVAMIGEVLRRRLRRLRESNGPIPDLILIDGGKGQLARAVQAMEEEGLTGIQILGLAKREELVVLPGRRDPIRLPRSADGLRLLQRVRNEAHRFAIAYHRRLRGKRQVRSGLDPLPGIGERRRNRLLRRFGSLDALRRARVEDLMEVEGIGRRTAERIREYLGDASANRAGTEESR